MASGYTVQRADASGVVAMRGSFWADPETYDLHRLEFHAEGIPPELLYADISTTIYYDVDRREGAEMVFSSTTRVESGAFQSAAWYNTRSQRIWTHEVPGVGTFFVRGSSFSLPPGFKTVWKTQLYPLPAAPVQ